jgi:hypothetical protein
MSHSRWEADWVEHNAFGRSAVEARRRRTAGDLTEFNTPTRVRFVVILAFHCIIVPIESSNPIFKKFSK